MTTASSVQVGNLSDAGDIGLLADWCPAPDLDTHKASRAVIDFYNGQGLTVATAESLTGGLVAAALIDVAGASKVIRGGVVTYATDLKASLLGVNQDLLAKVGPVDARVAHLMAVGAARVCGADVGIATTGVAGPEKQHGVDVGVVYISAHNAQRRQNRTVRLNLHGDRAAIRQQSVAAAFELLLLPW